MSTQFKVAISAGEVSGDQRGASLVRAIRQLNPELIVKGMGGQHLRDLGVETVIDSDSTAKVMGITEALGSLKILKKNLNILTTLLQQWKPDILILVDFPDFNLRLAKEAKRLGIPVFYFIPPKVWAWRSHRTKKLNKYTDRIATIFPFEKKFLEKRGVSKVEFVGHPFVEELMISGNEKEVLKKELGISDETLLVAVFPGSRSFEIKKIAKTTIESIRKLRESGLDITAVISLTSEREKKIFDSIIPEEDWIKKIVGRSELVLKGCDAGILKSGTCNLEAAFFGLPFVCVYKASSLSISIVKLLIKIKEASLVNIVRSKTVREFIQEDFTEDNIVNEVRKLLLDKSYVKTMKKNFSEVVDALRPKSKNSTDTIINNVAKLVLTTTNKAQEKEVFWRTFKYLKPYIPSFIFALFCMVLYGSSDGAVPFLVKYALDKVFQPENQQYLYIFPVVLIGITIIRAIGDFGQQFIMGKIGHRIVRDLRQEMNNHFLKLNPDFFITQSTANLLSRITNDVTLLRTLLTDSVAAIMRDSVRIVALLGAAIYLDPVLTLVAFIAFPLGIYPILRFGKKMRKLSRRGQDAIGSLSSMLQESILGNRIVKIFGAEEFEKERFRDENEKLTRTFIKSEKVRALTGPINEIIASFTAAAVLFYGATSVIQGTRTQGDFIAFLLSVFLLYDPFKKLSRVSSSVQQGLAGAQRIFEVLDTEPTIKDPENPLSLGDSPTISFESVSFKYPNAEQYALADITLDVKAGSKVALVGFSGSGKSTLVDLIPRFIDPEKGVIKLCGQDISKVLLKDLRSRIAMVSQHTFLFNDSILNNIRYGKQDATVLEIEDAARQAYALDFIKKLPNGFDTMVGEGGYSLSGGERQRIAIARAVLKNAPILILDEATASLDNRSEREVQNALEELEKHRTTIIVAHRLSTIQNVDTIFVFRDGCIVERGSHSELINKEGEYFRLHSYQLREPASAVNE